MLSGFAPSSLPSPYSIGGQRYHVVFPVWFSKFARSSRGGLTMYGGALVHGYTRIITKDLYFLDFF